MKRLTNRAQPELSPPRLRELLAAHGEWLCAETRAGERGARCGSPLDGVTLRAGEWDLSEAGGASHFSYRAGEAWRAWRVVRWEWTGTKLLLSVARRAGAERATLELAPRPSVREAARAVSAARLAECERLAAAACARVEGARVESVCLSAGARRGEPGRYARILLRARGARVAVTGAVVPFKAHETDALLASALLWWSRLGARTASEPAAELWLVAPRELAATIAERLPLLRQSVRRLIKLFSTNLLEAVNLSVETVNLSDYDSDAPRETFLSPVEPPPLDALLTAAFGRRRLPARAELSETAARLVSLAPAEIDAVRARHGETLRFRGLPFARVRTLAGRERVWFGPPGAGGKLLLTEENWPRLAKLVEELAEHRRAGAADPRHAFYRAAPEAWLESVLRRDITRLDPGLVVSPLHAQFRARREAGGGARPVDLLALRRDGRLVVVELKVSEDAALPLQAADYWRRVEAHRRGGDLARARLFGPLEIAALPPLVYLAAPALRAHRALAELARMIAPEIELYRFDLNEDWRAGVRVVRRARVN